MPGKPIVCISGAAGFIASHIVDLLLDNGFQVRAFDNSRENAIANLGHHADHPDLEILLGDIRQLNIDAFQGAQYVFHLAGMMDLVPSIEKPALYMDVNCQGTVRALEGARKACVKKFVYAASSSCYGDKCAVPTNEDAAINCCHPYALSKYLGEQAVLHWHRIYKLPVNSIRIFNSYGPRLRGSNGAYGAVFGVFLKQKLEGKPFTVVGDGTQGRDFVYVTDLAKAFYAAAITDHVGEVYNIGGGQPRSVNEIIELIGGGPIEYLPKRPGEPDVTWADITKAKNHLDWEPTISFSDGVERIVKEIESFRRLPLWATDNIGQATQKWFEALGRN